MLVMGTATDSPGMGQVGSKTGHSGKSGQPGQAGPQSGEVFFGVNIPNCNLGDFLHVYTDRSEALKVVKLHKKARFKPFRSRAEAVSFAVHGSESSNGSPNQSNCAVGTSVQSSTSDAEKPNPYKGPKAQDMARLRRVIESGDLKLVRNTVWDNPRYLISSGDTPSILQEGSRYNALHIAARSMNAAMAELILQTVGDPAFCRLLYEADGSDVSYTNVDRAEMLLDLYLNTPDKGGHETPLHFAVKFGALQVVAVLVSYAQCDRHTRNKFGQRPLDIVCARCAGASTELKQEIISLLENEFYVPVLRAQDNSVQPTVGQPFSPKEPPVLNTDPVSPRMEIHAFAGPMSQEQADEFHRQWRTPQRNPVTSKSVSVMCPKSCPPLFRLRDPEKGLERSGRELAAQHHVPWKEYWPFLDTFVDLASVEGLNQLEDFFRQRFESAGNQSSCYSDEEQAHNISNENDSLEVLKVDRSLDSSDMEPEVLSPVTQLCSMMKACTILDDSMGSGQGCGSPLSPSPSSSPANGSVLSSSPGRFFDWLSRKPVSSERNTAPENQNEAALSQSALNPFLCIEKSLQLFAKRIAVSLHHVVTSSTSYMNEAVCDVLRPEVKRVQDLVYSYMEDPRFAAVDYHLVHSRVAMSVAERLVGQLTPEERETFYNCLQDLLSAKGCLDDLSSDEEESFVTTSTPYRQARSVSRTSGSTNQRAAVRCVASQIVWALDHLQGSGPDGQSPTPPRPQVRTESECLEMWNSAYSCSCVWPPHNQSNFSRGSRKSGSMKRSISSSVGSDSRDLVSRRLNYEDEREARRISAKPSNDVNGTDEKQFIQDEEGDTFFTPPSSPVLSPSKHGAVSDSESDEMEDPEEGPSIFIEGSEPTRVDLDVVRAISDCHITPASHPHIFRWRHEVLLHPPHERERWPSSTRKLAAAPNTPKTPSHSWTPGTPNSLSGSISGSIPGSLHVAHLCNTPQWSRVTGAYSPLSSRVGSGDRPELRGKGTPGGNERKFLLF